MSKTTKTKMFKAVPVEPLRSMNGRVIPMLEGQCIFCGAYVETGRDLAGATDPLDPCWHVDGDFGCPNSPLNDEDGTGDHCRPYDLARMILEQHRKDL